MSLIEKMTEFFKTETELDKMRQNILNTYPILYESVLRESQGAVNRGIRAKTLFEVITSQPIITHNQYLKNMNTLQLETKASKKRLQQINEAGKALRELENIDTRVSDMLSDIKRNKSLLSNVTIEQVNSISQNMNKRKESLSRLISNITSNDKISGYMVEIYMLQQKAIKSEKDVQKILNNNPNLSNTKKNIHRPSLSRYITKRNWNTENLQDPISLKPIHSYPKYEQKYLMKIGKQIYDARALKQWMNRGNRRLPINRQNITNQMAERINLRSQGLSNNHIAILYENNPNDDDNSNSKKRKRKSSPMRGL